MIRPAEGALLPLSNSDAQAMSHPLQHGDVDLSSTSPDASASCELPLGFDTPEVTNDPFGQVDLLIEDLRTLLEDAKDDCLEVVCQISWEVCVQAMNFSTVGCSRTTVCLETAIPCTGFQQSVTGLRSILPDMRPVSFVNWQDWLDCDLSIVHTACRSRSSVWDWLCRFPAWYDEPFLPDCIHVYTDGSAASSDDAFIRPPSWAFNVWALGNTGQAYMGHAYGAATDAASPLYLGELGRDALTGEQLAIAWALVWIVEASCAFTGVTFVIHFDNLAAGEGAFARFRLPASHPDHTPTALSLSTAILRQCAQAVASVVGRHVRSHSGVPGNELADILAGYAGRAPSREVDVCLPLWPAQLVQHDLCRWAWLGFSNSADLPALHSLESEANRLFRQEAVRPYSFYGQTAAPESDPVCSFISLRLCTLNALSIKEDDELPQGLAVFGKRALLKQQLLGKMLHVVAIQETRTAENCVQPDADYIMLHSSCADGGCFGCALWLSKTFPVCVQGGDQVFFTLDACTVVAAGPRYIVAQADLPGCPITLHSCPRMPRTRVVELLHQRISGTKLLQSYIDGRPGLSLSSLLTAMRT